VNWLRAKARYDRWEEEKLLLENEMEWTISTFTHCKKEWEERIRIVTGLEEKKGHLAYAWREVHKWKGFTERAMRTFREVRNDGARQG